MQKRFAVMLGALALVAAAALMGSRCEFDGDFEDDEFDIDIDDDGFDIDDRVLNSRLPAEILWAC